MIGSLVNHIYSNSVQIVPEVGMGATILMYSDRHAATIIEVNKNTVVVQRDFAVRSDHNGMSDAQDYSHSPNPDGIKETFTLRNNGRWVSKGSGMRNGPSLLIGKRDHHHDFSF